jgi:molybdenum cofactor cytidylyltransferase
MANVQLGVVILGAGASARMGQPKLLLPWKSTTVIGQIISQWRGLGAAQIAVVLRENDVALADELARLDFSKHNCIVNPQPERGMFSSVVCAANWSGWKKEISHWAVALGDQPHLKTETLRSLLEFAAQHPGAVCQPEFAGRERHPVVLPREVFLALNRSRETSLKDFLQRSTAARRRCAVDDAGLALDLDTPEDLERAKRLPARG